MVDKSIPQMRITPKRFVDYVWMMDFKVISADSSMLDHNFISETSALAKMQNIDVQYLDFAKYEDPSEAITASENANFLKAIEGSNKPQLLWFDNCDALAPLDINLTFSLRSILTTQENRMIQAVFIARDDSLRLLFSDHHAAFYNSDYRITDYPQNNYTNGSK